MTEVLIKVLQAGPMVSIQDAGRSGHLRFGVCQSGPMDRFSHAYANHLLGMDPGNSCIEISMGGLTLDVVQGSLSVALVGAEPAISLNGQSLASCCVAKLSPGDRLSVKAGVSGNFTYLAFAGKLRTRRWLGSSSTHYLSALGGGIINSGEDLTVDDAHVQDEIVVAPLTGLPLQKEQPYSVVMGPQDKWFEPKHLSRLLEEPYLISSAIDRMGFRLQGPDLTPKKALSIPSEPITRGSIQISGDGVPTVLLADHQTTGGYPKVATLVSVETDRFAQQRPGDTVRFKAVTPAEAVQLTRKTMQSWANTLANHPVDSTSLTTRLMQSNLIGGVVSACDFS